MRRSVRRVIVQTVDSSGEDFPVIPKRWTNRGDLHVPIRRGVLGYRTNITTRLSGDKDRTGSPRVDGKRGEDVRRPTTVQTLTSRVFPSTVPTIDYTRDGRGGPITITYTRRGSPGVGLVETPTTTVYLYIITMNSETNRDQTSAQRQRGCIRDKV